MVTRKMTIVTLDWLTESGRSAEGKQVKKVDGRRVFLAFFCNLFGL
jgi:hypothetical protein